MAPLNITKGKWLASWWAGTPETIELQRQLGQAPMRMLLNDGGMAIMAEQDDDNPKRICVVDCQADYKRGKGYLTECVERDANARLISKAPELVEALNGLLADCGEHSVGCKELAPGFDDSRCCPVHVARALIAELEKQS